MSAYLPGFEPYDHHHKPAIARASDPATSQKAAQVIEPKRQSLCGVALHLIEQRPGSTADQLWEVCQVRGVTAFTTLDNLRRRISDLKARGLVYYYGEHDGQSRIWPTGKGGEA